MPSGGQLPSVPDRGLHHERVSRVHRTGACPGAHEVHLDLLLKALDDQGLPDRGEALGGRRGGDLHLLHGLYQALLLCRGQASGRHVAGEACEPAHLAGGLCSHTGEPVDQEVFQGIIRVGDHPFQVPDLNTVGVGLNRLRAGDHLVTYPLEEERFIVHLHPDAGVGVDDRGVFQVVEQPFLRCERASELDLHPGSVGAVPFRLLAAEDLRFIGLDIDLDLEAPGGCGGPGAGYHNGGNTGGELCVEHRRTDPDPLLPPALLDLVEPRTIEQLAEHVGDLVRDDPGTVVLHDDPVYLTRYFLDPDVDVRKDHRLLASIQGIIHRFFYRGDDAPDR